MSYGAAQEEKLMLYFVFANKLNRLVLEELREKVFGTAKVFTCCRVLVN